MYANKNRYYNGEKSEIVHSRKMKEGKIKKKTKTRTRARTQQRTPIFGLNISRLSKVTNAWDEVVRIYVSLCLKVSQHTKNVKKIMVFFGLLCSLFESWTEYILFLFVSNSSILF